MKKEKPFVVPDWACDAVWYQIFPERFRNGSRRNDPQRADVTDRDIPGWRVTPWGMDWYGKDTWEQGQEFWKTVFHRRYGGDLAGIRQKLGYLRDLGVNALYLNPVFQAPSLHKYDGSCFHHIDPTFGPDRAGDLKMLAESAETEDPATWVWTAADRYFVDLLAEAHRKGIRIIIDGVFNHTGREFFAFRDLLKNGRKSRYRDWFKIKQWNPDGTFDYDGWYGFKSLPEFARTEEDLAPPVRKYVFDITRRWMDPDGDGNPADGVDGWRLDVAYCVPHGFWRKWRKHVKRINRDAYLTAEIVSRADEYVQGDEFDAVMNYMWLYPTLNFFAPGSTGFGVREFRRDQDSWRKAYPAACVPVQQNLLDSHDSSRVLSMLENLREPVRNFKEFFHVSRMKENPSFRPGKPGAAAYQALRQALIFQMTFVGAPMLYYGTEVGLWGANDPCDRQPMLWPDVAYEDEQAGLSGKLPRRARKPDQKLLEFTKKAIALRHAEVALRRGDLRWLNTGNDRLLGYERTLDDRRITVLLNASDATAAWTMKRATRDLWTGRACPAGAVEVAARSWRVLGFSPE